MARIKFPSGKKGQPMNKSRKILWLSLIGIIGLLLWSSLTKIDQVVHAKGQVIASSRTQNIQSADGGVLVELRVKEGDKVSKGQVVGVLEKGRAEAAFDDVAGKVAALRMTVIRAQAMVMDQPFNLPKDLEAKNPEFAQVQRNLFRQRRTALVEQVAQLKESKMTALEELKLNEPLEKTGDVSKADILRLRRAVNEVDIQITATKDKYYEAASTEWAKAREDLNSSEQSLADRRELLDHTELVAPVDGLVKNIKVTTIGGVVRQGDIIMTILPTDSDLIVEAKINPSDMAFVAEGLSARVKLDAYDYSIFGSMNGVITYISPDALSEESKQGERMYYRAHVHIGEKRFEGKTGKEIEVKPGMTATVDILAGRRTVLSYLTKPLTKTLHESFTEK